jgi:hypothetical protein
MPLRDWRHPIDQLNRRVRDYRRDHLAGDPLAEWKPGPRGLDGRVQAALDQENNSRPASQRRFAVTERAKQARHTAYRRQLTRIEAFAQLNNGRYGGDLYDPKTRHTQREDEEYHALGFRVWKAFEDENRQPDRQANIVQRANQAHQVEHGRAEQPDRLRTADRPRSQLER